MMNGEPQSMSASVFHLEMCDQSEFLPSAHRSEFGVKLVDPPNPERNRELYRAVGEHWQWTDKLAWTEDDWRTYVYRDSLRTYVGCLSGEEIGYFELESQDDGNVEITYFGLFPKHIGKGLGGALLSVTVECAWDFPDTRRVWVHTCTHDHEHALENYRKRGFVVFKTDEPPGAA